MEWETEKLSINLLRKIAGKSNVKNGHAQTLFLRSCIKHMSMIIRSIFVKVKFILLGTFLWHFI